MLGHHKLKTRDGCKMKMFQVVLKIIQTKVSKVQTVDDLFTSLAVLIKHHIKVTSQDLNYLCWTLVTYSLPLSQPYNKSKIRNEKYATSGLTSELKGIA